MAPEVEVGAEGGVSLRAPFPWFGGKSRASHLVWGAFGPDVPNYVEPFAGSLAVLLARPSEPRIETVNDLDCYLANFWRAVQLAPAEVAQWADWPVNEADLHARHRWLVDQRTFRQKMRRDPEYFDAKIAGWWVWGICQWIGSGWCTNPEWTGRSNAGRRARGVNVEQRERRLAQASNWAKRPQLGKGSRGVHRGAGQKPLLRGDSGAAGSGIHASGLRAQMPKMDAGTLSRMAGTSEAIMQWMQALAARLRRVRVCCGDWKRVLGRSATECIGVTGILFDPPYSAEAGRDPALYAEESKDVAHDVRKWALKNGDNPKLRIALCGYEGEHKMPKGWRCVAWKANGGYAGAAGNIENSKRERIWFSPHCDRAYDQADLFAEAS